MLRERSSSPLARPPRPLLRIRPRKLSPPPTEEWGEWSDVDALVAPVGSTPDRVIVSGIGSSLVVALDRSTGEEVWRIGDEQQDGADDGYASEDDWDDWESGPVWEHGLVLHDDDTVYTQRGSDDGSLVAYSADDGTERWRMAPGDLDVGATADGWELSPSVLKSYTVADSGRLTLSHTEIADWDCHDGPSCRTPPAGTSTCRTSSSPASTSSAWMRRPATSSGRCCTTPQTSAST